MLLSNALSTSAVATPTAATMPPISASRLCRGFIGIPLARATRRSGLAGAGAARARAPAASLPDTQRTRPTRTGRNHPWQRTPPGRPNSLQLLTRQRVAADLVAGRGARPVGVALALQRQGLCPREHHREGISPE